MCAGATLNDINSKLKCAVVAGAANNQLHDEGKHGMMLLDKGIVYAPDFLINAGGLIKCVQRVERLQPCVALKSHPPMIQVLLPEILQKSRPKKFLP